MGISLAQVGDAPFGQPRPVALTLSCDGAHANPHRAVYDQPTFAEQLTAARADRWSVRVGDDARTLCYQCRRDYHGNPRVDERPLQGDLFA